jgi:hypothetical protein
LLTQQPLNIPSSERQAQLDHLSRDIASLLLEQARRIGISLPPALVRAALIQVGPPRAALLQPACRPACLPPLALPIEKRSEMTREEAQAQLATAAVVMALALKCELAAAERQQA